MPTAIPVLDEGAMERRRPALVHDRHTEELGQPTGGKYWACYKARRQAHRHLLESDLAVSVLASLPIGRLGGASLDDIVSTAKEEGLPCDQGAVLAILAQAKEIGLKIRRNGGKRGFFFCWQPRVDELFQANRAFLQRYRLRENSWAP